MSVALKQFIMAILKFIGWYVFKDELDASREARINKINRDYVERIKQEMYKDE